MSFFNIYADFDGVFNVTPSKETVSADIATENSEFLARKDQISWNPKIVGSFKQLLETGLYDFMWHTTWNHGSNIKNAADLMGLDNIHAHSVATLNKEARNRKEWTSWKADAIIENQILNPKPFIWIDDSAPIYWEDYVRGSVPSSSLVLIPKSRVGLSEAEILKIIDWSSEQLKQ